MSPPRRNTKPSLKSRPLLRLLREVDFALNVPKWAKKTHSRLDDQDARSELGGAWFGTE